MNLDNYIKDRFDVPELKRLGFFTTEKTAEEMSERICTYFGLESIYDYDYIFPEVHKPTAPMLSDALNILKDHNKFYGEFE